MKLRILLKPVFPMESKYSGETPEPYADQDMASNTSFQVSRDQHKITASRSKCETLE